MPRFNVKLILIVLVVVVTGIGFATAPVSSAGSGPFLPGAQVDPHVRSILERSCQDCHSDKTHYPWYRYLAPVALLLRRDVEEGRRHLNFSRWDQYPIVRRERLLSGIANQVRQRDMPPWQYTIIHRNAPLSDDEISAVFQWTQAERARLIGAPQ